MVRLSTVDPSSYSQPDLVTTTHSSLQWTVDFAETKLRGLVEHRFNVLQPDLKEILLDICDLEIIDVQMVIPGDTVSINNFISDAVDDIGQKLTLEFPDGIPKGELVLRIDYETSSDALALQWLTPEQTLGKQHPYMFSQCQAIYARSVVPCQDTPAVKFTYDARVVHPEELTALMGAIITKQEPGVTYFKQEVPIPACLLAIATGRLVSRTLGPISKVWAEPGIVNASANEFAETDKILKIAEELCGPYVWQQYDLLIMPPSFPYGGMENPCLTFLAPGVITGDKSLADVVAHEIAHSWTGNLVTNKNYEHFWLNEGFTVFLEEKIVGHLHGQKERDFHMLRNLTELKDCIRTQLANTPELTKLVVDLTNYGPDDSFSLVPYVKGSVFLRYLEDLFGGPAVFEPFLREYIKKYAYQSITTDDFKSTLCEYFSTNGKKDELEQIDWDSWLHSEGMPPIIPKLDESLAKISQNFSELWSTLSVEELKANDAIKQPISTHQLIDFLGKLDEAQDITELNAEKIALLESTYGLGRTRNAEMRFRFLRLVIRARLTQRIDEIIAFANSNFRIRFCRGIYCLLAKWPEVKPIAVESFERVRNQMIPICSSAIGKDLGLNS